MELKQPSAPTVSGDGFRLDESCVGQEFLFIPKKLDEVETKNGRASCVRSELWRLQGKDLEHLGEVLVFWKLVASQLEESFGEGVMGKIGRSGRAFILEPVSDATAKAMLAAAEKADLDF